MYKSYAATFFWPINLAIIR